MTTIPAPGADIERLKITAPDPLAPNIQDATTGLNVAIVIDHAVCAAMVSAYNRTVMPGGADKATDERTDAAARAIFCVIKPSHMIDADWDSGAVLGLGNAFRSQCIDAARASLAAAASEPVTGDSIDTHEFMQVFVAAACDLPNRDLYDNLIAYIHMHTARVVFACQREREESAAAPAPVSGMPDLASLQRFDVLNCYPVGGYCQIEASHDGSYVRFADVERLLNPAGETK